MLTCNAPSDELSRDLLPLWAEDARQTVHTQLESPRAGGLLIPLPSKQNSVASLALV